MDTNEVIKRVEEDLGFLRDRVLAVLLFGSYARGDVTRGDVDICVVAPGQGKEELLYDIFRSVDVFGKRYDVFVFEELPLYMKFEVIENHKVVLSRDLPELYEYLYFYRKFLEDFKQRQRKASLVPGE